MQKPLGRTVWSTFGDILTSRLLGDFSYVAMIANPIRVHLTITATCASAFASSAQSRLLLSGAAER